MVIDFTDFNMKFVRETSKGFFIKSLGFCISTALFTSFTACLLLEHSLGSFLFKESADVLLMFLESYLLYRFLILIFLLVFPLLFLMEAYFELKGFDAHGINE